jgi:transcriptional regulator with XRE-family HTH domain
MGASADRPSLGDIIRRQRELNEMSMRRFAELSGISNPYLSQIERGLREPSEKVMEAIARNLDLTVDALYEQAGIANEDDTGDGTVVEAIRADPKLTPRQRQALIEIYESFVGRAPRRRKRR